MKHATEQNTNSAPPTHNDDSVNKGQHTVQIAIGTDLNILSQMSHVPVGQLETIQSVSVSDKVLPDEVFENLPDLLREPCQLLTNRNEKEVFLIGALGVVSGVLPNIKAHYNGKKIEANLFCFVLAPYGSGKGSLEYAKKLVQPIHQQKRARYIEEQTQYKLDLAEYEKALKVYQRERKGEMEAPIKPVAPPNHMLLIPANNSKTGLYQLMGENQGRGIMFETEGDTLADTLKQDYGNFSDGLRKSFHHESISYFRRAESEYVEIEEPFLSVVLSSTYDQLAKLIPSSSNGLFSRFIYYELEPTREFHNVFDTNKQNYDDQLKQWAGRLKNIYDTLVSVKTPFWFDLQEHQKIKFREVFQEQKDELSEYVSQELAGTVNRLGIICFRIALITSALRELDKWNCSTKIVCTDQDFDNAVRIIEVLKKHSLSVFWNIKDSAISSKYLDEDVSKRERQKKECLRLHGEGFTYRQIALKVMGNEGYKSTVYRWIRQ